MRKVFKINLCVLFTIAESEQRSSDNYSSRGGGGSGGGNGYEDENPYDGEREDSDQESHGGGGGGNTSRRYYDKEQDSSTNSTGRAGSGGVVQRTTSVPKTGVTTAPPPKMPAQPKSKKIDLGAAATFGKSGSLDINSPTHTATPVAANQQRDLIEEIDLFGSAPQQTGVATSSALDNNNEFGDFSSAFGSSVAAPASLTTTRNNEDDFADFSAFESGPPPATASVPAFNHIPAMRSAPVPTIQPQQQQQQPQPPLSDNFLLLGMPNVNSLMSGGAVHDLMPSPVGLSPNNNNNQQDLLADFGDLALSPPIMGGAASGGKSICQYDLA